MHSDPNSQEPVRQARNVLVIGLDGVPLSLIEMWAEQGALPTLKRLMNRGATGPLRSTMPPTSGPSWSSFMTGMNPGKTGIYDFLYRRPGTYSFPPVDATRRGGRSLWRLLSDAGLRVNVLNVPLSYPVEPVNGTMVSGWMTPYSARDFTYPPELHAELNREIGKYHIYPTETFAEHRKVHFWRACYDLLEMLTRTSLHLQATRPADFMMTVFFDTDRVLHQTWHYLEPTHPWRADRTDKSAAVRDYFTAVDQSIGRLLESAGDDTLVIVMSDHGMGPAHNFIVLNNWLLNVGMLRLRRSPMTALRAAAFRAGFTLRTVHRLVDQLGLAKRAEYVGLYSTDWLLKLIFLSFLDVDWRQSKAYSVGRHVGSVYVNLRGREPQGCVAPGSEYEAVRDEITHLVSEFRDPRTGRPLIGRVLRREDIYSGPRFDESPDLILLPAEPSDIFFGLADFGSQKTVDTVYRYSGMHRDDGMLIMAGPNVRSGYTVEGAAIQDLAPTILHALGQPVPEDMDGHVLENAFATDYLSAFPLRRNGSSGDLQGSAQQTYTPEEEREVMERLRRSLRRW
jgi:predicted AlkP superfamily phosphohydrolase/phosphomutase